MKNYNINAVKDGFRKVRVSGHIYYHLKDILDYYGYSRHWWKDHSDEILDNKCNVIKHTTARYGTNHKANFVNWFTLNRLITVFLFQEKTGIKNVEQAKALTRIAGGRNIIEIMGKVNSDSSIDDMFRIVNEHYEQEDEKQISSDVEELAVEMLCLT